MNFDDYQRLAERTSGGAGCVYQGFIDWKGKCEAIESYLAQPVHLKVDVDFPSLLEEYRKARAARRLMAAAMGLAGETVEFLDAVPEESDQDPKKEASDVFWYLAEVCSCVGLKLSELDWDGYYGDENDVPGSLLSSAGYATEYLKKVTAHGHPLRVDHLRLILSGVSSSLKKMCDGMQWSVSDVMEINIRKLEKRYGGQFSPAASQNRVA